MQEYEEYMKLNMKNINPRQQILDNLGDLITYKTQQGHSFILLIDTNESYWQITTPIVNMCCQTGLKNAFDNLHPDLQETPTRTPGSQQIDYILITKDLIPFVKQGGILPLGFLHPSDHCCCYLDIDIEAALETPLQELTSSHRRNLQLTKNNALEK